MAGSNNASLLLRPVLTSALGPWAGGGQQDKAGGNQQRNSEQCFCSGRPSYLLAAETKSLGLLFSRLLVRFHDLIEGGMSASLQRYIM